MQDELIELKAMAETSLYFFGKEIIKNPLLTDIHEDLAAWVCSPERSRVREFQGTKIRGARMLILLPRDTLKTTFISVIYSLWQIVRNPDIRILIDSEARDLSMKILKTVKGLIDTSDFIKALWGNLNGSGSGYTWNLEEIRVKGRTDFHAKEDTIETAGVDVAITGRHFPLIIMDDLHSERNTRTKEQIQKVREHIQYIMPLLEAEGELLVIGTTWDDSDAYQWLQEMKDDNEVPLFDTYIKSAYLDSAEKLPFYPLRLPLDVLAVKKTIMGEDLFSAQYRNDPVPQKSAIFRKDDVRYQSLDTFPKDLNKFMLVDPLGDKENRQGDYFSAVTWGISPELNELGLCELYLIDGVCGHFNIDRQLEAIINLYLKTRPMELGIEKSGMSTLDIHLKNMLKSKNLYLKTVELKPSQRNKEQRIKQFVPYFRGGMVIVNDKLDSEFKDEFIYELSRFPKCKRDDCLDASAYIFDFLNLYPVGVKTSHRPVPQHFAQGKNSWMGS